MCIFLRVRYLLGGFQREQKENVQILRLETNPSEGPKHSGGPYAKIPSRRSCGLATVHTYRGTG